MDGATLLHVVSTVQSLGLSLLGCASDFILVVQVGNVDTVQYLDTRFQSVHCASRC